MATALSSFAQRQESQRQKIEQIEQQLVQPKSWHLTGEVVASHRPKDSALDEFIEFQTASVVPPTVTEEYTMSIEELIKIRISENLYDNPVRRALPVSSLPKKLPMVSAQKSELGLGELYSKNYEEEVLGVKEEDPISIEQRELIGLYQRISSVFDSLSNQSGTPRIIIENTHQTQKESTQKAKQLAESDSLPATVSITDRLVPEAVQDRLSTLSDETTDAKSARQRKKEQFGQRSAKKEYDRVQKVSREREEGMRVISLRGDTVDEADVNKETLEKLQRERMRGKNEKEQIESAMGELKRKNFSNVTITTPIGKPKQKLSLHAQQKQNERKVWNAKQSGNFFKFMEEKTQEDLAQAQKPSQPQKMKRLRPAGDSKMVEAKKMKL
ncbi:putative U3 small nucleolar ribonucleoprotein [Blattamonas nauphoetae]|uniref:U3 small nucleolar ribonucleoprotein n=1 Tax=Blattamonas nauphoetae TaxID=2049346 RepID=A0ABQ9XJD5_9EUKA|nr:putative U3 small nucleolar ribonucleoprotein [Blattamonas nauphoetae]